MRVFGLCSLAWFATRRHLEGGAVLYDAFDGVCVPFRVLASVPAILLRLCMVKGAPSVVDDAIYSSARRNSVSLALAVSVGVRLAVTVEVGLAIPVGTVGGRSLGIERRQLVKGPCVARQPKSTTKLATNSADGTPKPCRRSARHTNHAPLPRNMEGSLYVPKTRSGMVVYCVGKKIGKGMRVRTQRETVCTFSGATRAKAHARRPCRISRNSLDPGWAKRPNGGRDASPTSSPATSAASARWKNRRGC